MSDGRWWAAFQAATVVGAQRVAIKGDDRSFAVDLFGEAVAGIAQRAEQFVLAQRQDVSDLIDCCLGAGWRAQTLRFAKTRNADRVEGGGCVALALFGYFRVVVLFGAGPVGKLVDCLT